MPMFLLVTPSRAMARSNFHLFLRTAVRLAAVATLLLGTQICGAASLITPSDGDWSAPSVVLRNTPEAALMVRSGDIDNLGFGWPRDYDPFVDNTSPVHSWPWKPGAEDPPGTDSIMIGSGYKGVFRVSNDGYSAFAKKSVPIVLNYDLRGMPVQAATIQVFVDDIQAPTLHSHFQVTLNGVRAPFLEDVINGIDLTGPVGKLITVAVPPDFLHLLTGGSLSLLIDDPTTGVGDGFAVDFVKLLIDPTSIGPRAFERYSWSTYPFPPAKSGLMAAGPLAADSAGNLYIADNDSPNNTNIWRLSTDGTWTIAASGFDTGASPAAVTFDPAGNLYVAQGNLVHRRDVNGVWSVLFDYSTVPKASQLGLAGMAVDSAGNVYVSDLSIVQVRDDTGRWSTVASFIDSAASPGGTGPGSVMQPGPLAVDAVGNLYVADYGNHRIQRRDLGGAWTILAPAGSGPGQVVNPRALAVDAAGNLYALGDRLQRRSAAGHWDTLATVGPAARVNVPQALAVDNDGNLYIVQVYPASLLKVSKVPPPFLGDVNGDGRITVADATLLLRIVIGNLTPTSYQKAAGDLKGDDVLSVADVVLLLRRAIGL